MSGQDGSYLGEFLLDKGYEVHGILRRASEGKTGRIDPYKENVKLHWGDLQNDNQLSELIYSIQPDEIYNLGAQSDVRISFDIPEYTGEITGVGVTRMLEAMRKFSPKSKFYQACSSEMFGKSPPRQDENSIFLPQNPYGIAKLYGYHMAQVYRDAYNLFVGCGILFNHESPRRGGNFVTKKVVKAACEISKGETDVLYLGNLDSRRDWGYSPDYVKAMWMILQHDKPDNFVIGTGETHSVRELLDEAFGLVDLDWHKYVKIDHSLYRPTETCFLQSNPTKANTILGWEAKTKFKDLIKIMMDAEKKGVR